MQPFNIRDNVIELAGFVSWILCTFRLWLLQRSFGLRWRRSRSYWRPTLPIPATIKQRTHPKPAWVRQELIRFKALSPDLGCRVIAEFFNRRFGHRQIQVGKTFVAEVLRQSKLDIIRLRRELKHRTPRPMPINHIWALDLTGKADSSGKQRMLLGLLDHGSRACLRLCVLHDKRSLTILRELIVAFRRFGLPGHLRVDNEACFNSRLMKLALALLGIRLETTQPHCPWQNGRIERFFGTLKRHLDRIAVADANDLHAKLVQFRCWYNHVRPHQHLHGHTPAEAWDGRGKSCRPPRWFTAWGGLLTGWYFPL